MTTNTFSANIKKFCAKTKLSTSIVAKKLAFDGFDRIMRKSPVDTGRFRGSWRIALINPDLTVLPELKEKSGLAVGMPLTGIEQGRAATALAEHKPGQTIYITNNLPYADRLENQAWSKQAPNGMLKITFEELKSGLSRVIKSLA